MDEFSEPPGEKKPWYNDGDKVSGAFATITVAAVVVVVLILLFKLCVFLITGDWTL